AGGCHGHGQGRRRRRASRRGAHGTLPRHQPLQPGIAPGTSQERLSDPRFPYEGTQEVRPEGRAQALPVHQALKNWCRSNYFGQMTVPASDANADRVFSKGFAGTGWNGTGRQSFRRRFFRPSGSGAMAQAAAPRSRPARQPARGCCGAWCDHLQVAQRARKTAIYLGGIVAVEITMKELLEAGVHFGHQTRRWNPKMKEYIFGERNGIYIIDLQKTLKMFKEASKFVQ